MAQRVADTIGDRDITQVWSSPLERAQQTAQPTAEARRLPIVTDERVIESTNLFEGEAFRVGSSLLRKPSAWRYLWNPFRPSWGEPYTQVVERMVSAINDVRRVAAGPEAPGGSPPPPRWGTRPLPGRRALFPHPPPPPGTP